jgi:hypothetical protein
MEHQLRIQMQLQTVLWYSYFRGMILIRTDFKTKHKLYIASQSAPSPDSEHSACTPDASN